MKILEVKNLSLGGVKAIRYAKFADPRGYFAETFRKSDTATNEALNFLKNFDMPQINESYCVKGVIKGLHFQWEPPLGKLVRVIRGHMLDIILDIRKASPTFGKVILYNMPDQVSESFGEWIWIPPGFAHGMIFTEDSLVEYFFTQDYNPPAEAGISPLTDDLDWSLCDKGLKQQFDELIKSKIILSDRDKVGFSLTEWSRDKRSENF